MKIDNEREETEKREYEAVLNQLDLLIENAPNRKEPGTIIILPEEEKKENPSPHYPKLRADEIPGYNPKDWD